MSPPLRGRAARKTSGPRTARDLPDITIVIEWENAIAVEDKWTCAAIAALEREIASVAPRMAVKPRVMYLYDKNAVDPAVIEKAIAATAPRLKDLADVEFVPTDGLTYYKLKNYGISRAKTALSVMLDSDAAPQPGWLENLIKPFEDPKIMAVGGFTVLGYDDILSKTFALGWIFDLREEAAKTVKREKIHANNCAVRTDFFRDNPFPDLPVFKKQCGFWLRDLIAKGHGYTRTADAMTVHAPHPGYKFIAWRGWTMGMDRDYQAFQSSTRSRAGRLAFAFRFFAGKVGKSWWRIWTRGKYVDLPIWQRPAAMVIILGFYGIGLAGEMKSALTRSFEPLPEPAKARSEGSGARGASLVRRHANG
ncbi:MAG TPA: glycosyltransferase [Sphingomicrobium sp.]|nr:glycosyltransferase [Sphingomicrobium sp.]